MAGWQDRQSSSISKALIPARDLASTKRWGVLIKKKKEPMVQEWMWGNEGRKSGEIV